MNRKELKIISLNTWAGKTGDNLLSFFKENQSADIFLLQEVMENATHMTKWEDDQRENLFSEIKDILLDYDGYFAPVESNEWGLAAFIKKGLNISEVREFFVHRFKDAMVEKDGTTLGKSVQYFSLHINNKNINILNVHGLWTGKGKDDSEDRIKQSENILNLIKTLEGEIILCGDFNLNPDTESIKMIEDFGLKNLIRENNIATTRTSFYSKREVSPFADYTFVSKDVKVESFEIMKEEVSDHAAMKIVISI